MVTFGKSKCSRITIDLRFKRSVIRYIEGINNKVRMVAKIETKNHGPTKWSPKHHTVATKKYAGLIRRIMFGS